MSGSWIVFALGLVIGLAVRLEVARRAYRETTADLADTLRILGVWKMSYDTTQRSEKGEGDEADHHSRR